jgi:hypothetical protein
MSKLYFPQYTLCSPSGLHRNSRERSVSWVSVFLLRLEPALLPNSCQCSGQIKQGNKIPQNSMFSMHLTFHTHTQTHTNTHSYTHNTHSHTCLCAHAQDHLHALHSSYVPKGDLRSVRQTGGFTHIRLFVIDLMGNATEVKTIREDACCPIDGRDESCNKR